MITFPASNILWTIDNMILLEIGYKKLELSIELLENSVNMLASFPKHANATIG